MERTPGSTMARGLARAIALGLLCTSTAGWAQSAGESGDSPVAAAEAGIPRWIDTRVPLAERRAAQALFVEGTRLVNDGFFVEAEAKYEAALERLNHPGIHYNLAIIKMRLGKPIQADEHFEWAMIHGSEPLGPDKYTHAENYRRLLGDQIGVLDIVCETHDAEVSLNGKSLFTGPGRVKQRVRVGQHQVIARKGELVPDARDVVVAPRETLLIEVAPRDVSTLVTTRRRWRVRTPWAILGAGLAMASSGAILHFRADRNFAGFDRQFGLRCGGNGCLETEIPDDLSGQLDRATWQHRLAGAAYGIGAAAAAAGLIMVYLNRPRILREETMDVGERISFVPLVGSAPGAGLMFRFKGY